MKDKTNLGMLAFALLFSLSVESVESLVKPDKVKKEVRKLSTMYRLDDVSYKGKLESLSYNFQTNMVETAKGEGFVVHDWKIEKTEGHSFDLSYDDYNFYFGTLWLGENVKLTYEGEKFNLKGVGMSLTSGESTVFFDLEKEKESL